MTTGEKIKEARKKAGMTQAELGTLLGVSGSMIGQWENDFRHPKLETRAKIADALGIKDFELASIHKPNKNHHREIERMMGKEEGYLEKNAVQQMRRTREEQLLTAYGKLNDFGQAVALVDVERLSTQEKYTDSLEPRTDEERALVEEGRLAELWEKRYSGPQEPPAAPSEGIRIPPPPKTPPQGRRRPNNGV